MLIRERIPEDLPAVRALLAQAELPPDGLEATLGWVAADGATLVGHVALESTPDAAVLRSLVVTPSAQGHGLGERLMQTAEEAAQGRTLVLRTETVGPWMQRRGYRRVSLEHIPQSVRATTQFKDALCSQCPVFMKHAGGSLFDADTIKAEVRSRYGAIAASSGNCCGPTASCGCSAPGTEIGYAMDDLLAAPEGANLGLGCGNPVALASLRPGEVVLDLGSGAGFDAFLAARQVGPTGRVIGVDMTPEMLERARGLAAKHGYANVEFWQGDIEALPVEDGSVDAIISNCVINLTTDKVRTFREAFRVLKPGGRLMVSDLVLLKPLPAALRQDMDAYAACLAGALLKEDYLGAIRTAGFQALAIVGESTYDFGGMVSDASSYVSSLKISAVKPAYASVRDGCCG